MKRNFTPLTALIFILLAAVGSANAGDCMKLCDGSFWRKNPTLADVKAEIAKGADIHDDIAGYTPLHFAAKESTPEIIQYLEDQGAKLEAKTRGDTTVPGGHTPLHHAITGWDVARVKAMTKAGADIDSRIGMGMTALKNIISFYYRISAL